MDELQDYYAILDVPRDAPEVDIRRAFRHKAKKLHPDSQAAGEVNPDLSEEFRLLTEAYDTLKDPARRQAYDVELAQHRRLTAPSEGKQGGAFIKGLAAGLIIAVLAVGAKVYIDRASLKGNASKSQESLRSAKLPVSESANRQSQGAEPTDGLSALAPGPNSSAAAEDNSEQKEMTERDSALASKSFTPSPVPEGQAPSTMGQPSQEAPEVAATPNSTVVVRTPTPEGQGAAVNHPAAVKSPHTPAGAFAASIASLETELNTGGASGVAAHRLMSLVNASISLDELTAGAAVAKRADTQNLINSRIAALREASPASSSSSEPVTGVAPPPKPAAKPGTIEIAVGFGGHGRIVYLTPGQGLTEGFSDCSGCPEMAVIPSGQTTIGSRPESTGFRPEEAPAHKVSIRKPLGVSKHWITGGEWRTCVEAGACRPTLSSFLAAGSEVPVTRVSWYDAISYVEWLSGLTGHRYRLLSEAEWEYAAQAQGHRGADLSLKQDQSGVKPLPEFGMLRFGSRLRHLGASKANGWGLYAMPGGVLEWVEDCWHPNYTQAPADGSAWRASAGGDCSYRVVRGGFPAGVETDDRRAIARAREFTDARAPTLGFRVAREIAPAAKTALGGAPVPPRGN
jgi:formylglycine-generating enzyme required for sulfatase activity/curved DNA-binding protein CbpA